MSRDAETTLVVEGAACRIEYAVRLNGSMPAKEFIANLLPQERASLAALLNYMTQEGRIWNRDQFKKVRGKIFEFKKGQVRLFTFQVGRSWLLTSGYKKKKGRLDPKEIDRAERIRDEHMTRPKPTRGGR